MRLTPLLALLAGFATTIPAVELAPGFTLGGYGEAFVRGEVREAGFPRHSPTTDVGETEKVINFNSDAALKAAYTADDRWRLRLDLRFYDEAPFANSTSTVLLEQAFIDYDQTAWLTWRAGRFETAWLGWEGFNTPEQWRVNHSAAWSWNVQNHSLKPNGPFLSDGVGMMMATTDDRWHAEFYVVDDVMGDGDDAKGTDKALGASFSTKIPSYGRIEFGTVFDPRSTSTGPGQTSAHAAAFDLNTDITAFREAGWFFASEVQFNHHPKLTVGPTRYGNDLVALVMGNYAFTPTVSTTVMVDYVERGSNADDNEVLETAVALLTRPHPQVRFNTEVFYWSERADRADAWGMASVLLLALP